MEKLVAFFYAEYPHSCCMAWALVEELGVVDRSTSLDGMKATVQDMLTVAAERRSDEGDMTITLDDTELHQLLMVLAHIEDALLQTDQHAFPLMKLVQSTKTLVRDRGRVVTLFGGTGYGKSTYMSCIAQQLVDPDARVHICRDVFKLPTTSKVLRSSTQQYDLDSILPMALEKERTWAIEEVDEQTRMLSMARKHDDTGFYAMPRSTNNAIKSLGMSFPRLGGASSIINASSTVVPVHVRRHVRPGTIRLVLAEGGFEEVCIVTESEHALSHRSLVCRYEAISNWLNGLTAIGQRIERREVPWITAVKCMEVWYGDLEIKDSRGLRDTASLHSAQLDDCASTFLFAGRNWQVPEEAINELFQDATFTTALRQAQESVLIHGRILSRLPCTFVVSMADTQARLTPSGVEPVWAHYATILPHFRRQLLSYMFQNAVREGVIDVFKMEVVEALVTQGDDACRVLFFQGNAAAAYTLCLNTPKLLAEIYKADSVRASKDHFARAVTVADLVTELALQGGTATVPYLTLANRGLLDEAQQLIERVETQAFSIRRLAAQDTPVSAMNLKKKDGDSGKRPRTSPRPASPYEANVALVKQTMSRPDVFDVQPNFQHPDWFILSLRLVEEWRTSLTTFDIRQAMMSVVSKAHTKHANLDSMGNAFKAVVDRTLIGSARCHLVLGELVCLMPPNQRDPDLLRKCWLLALRTKQHDLNIESLTRRAIIESAVEAARAEFKSTTKVANASLLAQKSHTPTSAASVVSDVLGAFQREVCKRVDLEKEARVSRFIQLVHSQLLIGSTTQGSIIRPHQDLLLKCADLLTDVLHIVRCVEEPPKPSLVVTSSLQRIIVACQRAEAHIGMASAHTPVPIRLWALVQALGWSDGSGLTSMNEDQFVGEFRGKGKWLSAHAQRSALLESRDHLFHQDFHTDASTDDIFVLWASLMQGHHTYMIPLHIARDVLLVKGFEREVDPYRIVYRAMQLYANVFNVRILVLKADQVFLLGDTEVSADSAVLVLALKDIGTTLYSRGR